MVVQVIPWDYVPNFKALLAELHMWTNLDAHPHIVPLLRIYGEHPDSQNLHLVQLTLIVSCTRCRFESTSAITDSASCVGAAEMLVAADDAASEGW